MESLKEILPSVKDKEEGLEYKSSIENKLKEELNAKKIFFLSSASAGIHLIYKMYKNILIQDQGIWKGYYDIAKYYDVNLITIKSNYGILQDDLLEDYIEKYSPQALIIQSLSGYIAHQNVKDLYKVCKRNNVALINDISGSIFLKDISTCKYSDILICSTGKPKLLNIGFGGFIATNLDIKNYKRFLYAFKVPNIYYRYLNDEIQIAKERLKKLIYYAKIFKEEIDLCLHKDRIGICIGIKYNKPEDLIKRFKFKLDDRSSLITLCPNISRFNAKGFVLELKKIDVLKIEEEMMIKLLNHVKKLL